MAERNILLAWSSGKDSAWALHRLRRDPAVRVVGLLTTVNEGSDRVNMHAVRRQLLLEQIGSTGLPPWIVELPHPCSDGEYGLLMGNAVQIARSQDITAIAFGDLFLRDVRRYREEQLAGSGVDALFPVWTEDSKGLAGEMMASGLKARITCVDPRLLDGSFAGREWDAALLKDLPPGVDPCGENGEYHTFAYGGPMFSEPVDFKVGETVIKDGFVFTDLLTA